MSGLRQASFNSGEISPLLYGRFDHPRYASAVRKMLNFVALPQGAAQNRPGTKLVAAVKDSASKPRLVPFVFSSTQTYVLEVGFTGGAGYVRFHQNGAPVVAFGVPYEVAAAPFLQAALPYLKWSQSGDVLTVCYGGQDALAAAISPQELRRLAHTNWTVGATNFGFFNFASFAGTQLENGGNQPDGTHPAKLWCWQATQLWKENATGNVFETSPSPLLPLGVHAFGLYDNTFAYAKGDIVYRTADIHEGFFTSLANANTGNDPATSPTFWVNGLVLWPDLPPLKLTLAFGAIAGFTFQGFNIYRGLQTGTPAGAIYGLLITTDAAATYWKDDARTPDFSVQPPKATDPFAIPAGHDYPSSVGYFEQRRIFARQVQHPARIQASKIGQITNFDTTIITQADDAVSFDLASTELDEIRSLVPLTTIFALTQSGVWTVRGYQGSALTPTSINARKQQHSIGASWVSPARVGEAIIYEQDGGGAVYDFVHDAFYDVGRSTDISVGAQHFLEGHTVVVMAYAARPRKTVWIVRDDGLLLGLTYARSSDPNQGASVAAWHQHTTDGTVEDVCVVPEGTEDAVYLLVNRTIGGQTKRYIERMATRLVTDVRLGVFLDAALTFDGRNTGAVTMKATGATYAGGDEVTILASAPTFVPTDVGSAIVEDPDGSLLKADGKTKLGGPFRMTILAYVDPTHVTARLDAPLAAELQNVATTSWGFARRNFKGLDHLEGKTVAVLADGAVATAAKQDSYLVVAAGQVSIDEPAVIVHAGLSYVSDLELLDVATDKSRLNVKSVSRAALEVVASRGMLAGETFDKLKAAAMKEAKDVFGNPGLKTGIIDLTINGSWNTGGRACFRQVDPLPLTIVAAVREVVLGGS